MQGRTFRDVPMLLFRLGSAKPRQTLNESLPVLRLTERLSIIL